MGVVGICRCKDEADVIEATVRRMLAQVDHVIVEDNGSIDGTVEILEQLDVELLHDPTVGYYQSAAMSRLAAYAAIERDAAWVVPFDADEAWYSPFYPRVADCLAEVERAAIVTAALYDHVATAEDPDDPDPVTRMGWRRTAAASLPKVACRPYPRVTIHQGNHAADYGRTIDELLVVRHYPYRSAEQFVSKARNGAAAYAATDLPEDVGKHWRDYGRILDEHGPEALAEVFREWFWAADPRTDSSLIFDPAPRPGIPSDGAR